MIQQIKTTPWEYARKAVNPLWWVRQFKKFPYRRMEAKECQRIRTLLAELDAGILHSAAQYQHDKLLQILQYADRHCPYYKDIFQQAGSTQQAWRVSTSYRSWIRQLSETT